MNITITEKSVKRQNASDDSVTKSDVISSIANNRANSDTLKRDLIDRLKDIPPDWVLIPTQINKHPNLAKGWNLEQNYLTRDDLIKHLQSNKNAVGYGVICSKSTGLVAVDVDGIDAVNKLEELANGDLPTTVSFSSGLDGRLTLLYSMPDCYQETCKEFTIKIPDRLDPVTGKAQQLEFRFNTNRYSILPPSIHPFTGEYKWINSPENTQIAEAPFWLICEMFNRGNKSKKFIDPETLQLPVNIDIPLQICSGREIKDLLSNPPTEGSRNTAAFKIAKELIGIEHYLNNIGQRYSGNAEKLYYDFCASCNPPIADREADNTWRSASSTVSNPALDPHKIDTIIKFHYIKNREDDNNLEPLFSDSNNQEKIIDITTKQPIKSSQDSSKLHLEIKEFCLGHYSTSEKLAFLSNLARKYSRLLSEIREHFTLIESELETEENLQDVGKQVDQLQTIENGLLDIDWLFPKNLATELKKAAHLLDVPVEPLVTMMIPVLGSLINPDVEVEAWCEFTQHIIFWGFNNALTGEKKTPILKLFYKPLKDLQADLYSQYKLAKSEYDFELNSETDPERKKELEKNPPTSPRDLYFNSVTTEKIGQHLAEYNQNALVVADEVIGFFKSLAQYKKGGVDGDLAKLLELYNGYGIKNDTKNSGCQFSDTGGLAIAGGIQPEKLAEMLKHGDPQGLIARALICTYQGFRSKGIDRTLTHDLSSVLNKLYSDFISFGNRTKGIKQKLKFDSEALAAFSNYSDVNDDKVRNATSESLRGALNKNPGKCLRFAGLLHILEYITSNPIDDCKTIDLGSISLTTFVKAAGLTEYYSNQFIKLYASQSVATGSSSEISKIITFINSKEDKKSSLNHIRQYCLQNKAKDYVMDLFLQIEKLNKGKIIKQGKSVILSLIGVQA